MLDLNFDPFPLIETKRLILRKITVDDASDIYRLRTNEQAMQYIHRPRLLSIDEAKELIEKMNQPDRIQWGIRLKDTDGIIGTIGYHRIEKENYRAEIGYMLQPQYWNKGLTTEAIRNVIGHGFAKMKLHSIEAIIDPGNAVSRKVLKKFNFVKEAYFKENFFFQGKFYDSEVYSLLSEKD